MRLLHSLMNTPLTTHSLASSTIPAYNPAALINSLLFNPAPLLPVPIVSTKTSVACALIKSTSTLTTSLLRSVLGACKKLSLMYVYIPAAQRRAWNARLRPSGDERGEDAAREERVAPRLKMTDAFSYANDSCEICLSVKASSLHDHGYVMSEWVRW